MKQFTKAIKREIEMFGKKIILTITEHGVCFREKKCRQNVAVVSWADILARFYRL